MKKVFKFFRNNWAFLALYTIVTAGVVINEVLNCDLRYNTLVNAALGALFAMTFLWGCLYAMNWACKQTKGHPLFFLFAALWWFSLCGIMRACWNALQSLIPLPNLGIWFVWIAVAPTMLAIAALLVCICIPSIRKKTF